MIAAPSISDKAHYIREHGELLAKGNTSSYSFEYFRYSGMIYKISYYLKSPHVAINMLSSRELSDILSCSDLDFGEW